MPELRKDPILGRWVIISTERGRRPSDFGKEPEENKSKTCPFCPGNEHLTPPEIISYRKAGTLKDTPGWWVRVVPNKYPALIIEGKVHRQGEGMYDKMDGIGAHEVIIESPDHHRELQELDDKNAEDVFWMYRDRIMDLKKDPRFEYIIIFKNKGSSAGASLSHPHSQLIATPMVPVRVTQEIEGGKKYYDFKERCVFCDIIDQEISDGVRIVAENESFIAFCPYASRFPFEICVIPKEHDSQFEDIHKHEVTNLAKLVKTTLSKLNQTLENPPFNFLLHTSPIRQPNLIYYHWHIEIIPKLTKVAGFEWATGFYINPTAPEVAARFLRETEV